MQQINFVTWLNYIEDFSTKEIVPKQLLVDGIDKIFNLRQQAFAISNHCLPFISLLDYTCGKYILVSPQFETVMNIPNYKMLDGGIDFVLDIYHPEDFRLFNEQIFNARLGILKELPPDQHKNYIFSFNYRVKNGKGEYVNILQRNTFIQSDDNSKPLLNLCVCSKIDHFKSENPVIQLVERVDPITGDVKLFSKNTYYLYEEDRIFSKREREILLYIAEGLTSKQIADKLFISEHTVINHKRNMQHKSNTQNTVALISFAFRQHLL